MSKDRTQAIPAFIDLAAQQTHLGDSVETAISAVLKHGQFVLGPEVAELERQLAAFCGAKHCVSCANGTDALLLALMAEGVGKGDAVFVPAFTFVATVEVVVLSAPRRSSSIFAATRSTWMWRASKLRSPRPRNADSSRVA